MEKTIELRLDTEEIKRMLTEKKDSEPKQNPHRKNVIELYAWCKEMLNGTHILIAGCSGSGKSVAINDLLYTAMLESPEKNLFCLIDLKRVELIDYADAPHTVAYVDKPEQVERALNGVLRVIDERYDRMQAKREKKSSEPVLWIVIDEYADLVCSCPKKVQTMIQRISQIGRAANVKLLLATQRPTKEIIKGATVVNLDTRLALRTITAQDSRNIIQVNGAEALPDYGFGIMQIKGRNRTIEIPLTEEEKINERVQYWINEWK